MAQCQGNGPPCGGQQECPPPQPISLFLEDWEPMSLVSLSSKVSDTNHLIFFLSFATDFFFPAPPPNLPLTVSCSPASLTFEMWSLLGKLAVGLGLITTFPQGPVCVWKLDWDGGWGTAEMGVTELEGRGCVESPGLAVGLGGEHMVWGAGREALGTGQWG